MHGEFLLDSHTYYFKEKKSCLNIWFRLSSGGEFLLDSHTYYFKEEKKEHLNKDYSYPRVASFIRFSHALFEFCTISLSYAL